MRKLSIFAATLLLVFSCSKNEEQVIDQNNETLLKEFTERQFSTIIAPSTCKTLAEIMFSGKLYNSNETSSVHFFIDGSVIMTRTFNSGEEVNDVTQWKYQNDFNCNYIDLFNEAGEKVNFATIYSADEDNFCFVDNYVSSLCYFE